MAMRVSESLLSFLCSYEGLRTSVYADSGGVKTIGCGHTGSGVNRGTITKSEAYELLERDTQRFADCVNGAITAPLTQSMFDALVSLAFNVGCTGFKNTGIPDLINKGHYGTAAQKWKQTNLRDRRGNYLAGLARRREAEVAMFWADGMPKSGSTGGSSAQTVTAARNNVGRTWPILPYTGLILGMAALVWGLSRRSQRRP